MSKVRLAIVAILVLLAALTLIKFVQRGSTYEPSYQKVSSNVLFPAAINNSIYYFSGSSFVKYDLSTRQTTRLSDYLYIDEAVSSLSWTENSAIFFAPASQNDDLEKAAEKLRADPTVGHWWRYDFSTKKLQLLSFDNGACQEMVEARNTIYCSAQTDGSSTKSEINAFSLSNRTYQTVVNSDDKISKLSSRNNSLYFVVSDFSGKDKLEKVQLGEKSNAEAITSSDHHITSYAAGSDSVLILEDSLDPNRTSEESEETQAVPSATSDQVLRLVQINGGKELSKKDVSGLPGMVVGVNNVPSFFSYSGLVMNVDNNEIKRQYKLPALTSFTSLLFANNSGIFSINSSGEFSVDNLKNKVSKPALLGPDAYHTSPSSSAVNFYVDNLNKENKTPVFLYSRALDFRKLSSNVDSFLKQEGFDPNLFAFDWNINATGEPTRLSPNVELISRTQ